MEDKELKYDDLINILSYADSLTDENTRINELSAKFRERFNKVNKTKAVLGIDIYKYSSMEEDARNMVPFVGQILRDTTISKCLDCEKTIFKGKDMAYFKENFINTGDGGYFIFDNPIQAIVFAMYFEIVVRLFNSYRLYPELREILNNKATLRYAMTYDKVYKYQGGSYGAGIITNARILSKDKLDRFIIDENVYDWFMKNIGGVENLQIIDDTMFFNIKELEYLYREEKNKHAFDSPILDPKYYTSTSSGNSHRKMNMLGVNTVDIQKIGEIKAKNDRISVYNLHIQCSTVIENHDRTDRVAVSLGNLNISGISED